MLETIYSDDLEKINRGTTFSPYITQWVTKAMAKEEPWATIYCLYKKPNPIYHFIGSYLNAVYNLGIPMFIMSNTILKRIINKDKNIEQKSISTKQYKLVIKLLIDTKMIEFVVKPSAFSQKTRRAALIRILWSEIRSRIESIEKIEEKIYNEYCIQHKIQAGFYNDKLIDKKDDWGSPMPKKKDTWEKEPQEE